MGKLLTASEVAAGPLQGRRTRSWVLGEARAGRIPHLRLGPKTVLFDPDEIARWIESRRITAEATNGGS